jgi:integrase
MTARNLSLTTIEAREGFARARMNDWGTFEQDAAVIMQWLSAYFGHTRRTYHDHLQAFYGWLVETDRLATNPMDQIPRPPTPKPRPRPLSRDDAARSLLAASGDLRAFILLGRFAGLRAHEIAKMAGEDIDDCSLYVFGKGGVGMVLPTHPALWELAQSYPRHGFWFPSDRSASGHVTPHHVTMKVSRHFAALGIEGASHRNRHLYGTNLLRGGANIRVVQELMRHADISTTIRYLGVDQEEKVAAIQSLTA